MKKNAFTILELLVVLAVIGVFSAIAYPNISSWITDRNVKKEVYDKYGLFDLQLSISADFDLMLRFLEKHQISSVYLPKILVKMRTGGQSNNSIKNIIISNKSILRSFSKNKIKVNKWLYLFNRLMPKLIQVIKKGRQ